jgi:hypothetical protein
LFSFSIVDISLALRLSGSQTVKRFLGVCYGLLGETALLVFALLSQLCRLCVRLLNIVELSICVVSSGRKLSLILVFFSCTIILQVHDLILMCA